MVTAGAGTTLQEGSDKLRNRGNSCDLLLTRGLTQAKKQRQLLLTFTLQEGSDKLKNAGNSCLPRHYKRAQTS